MWISAHQHNSAILYRQGLIWNLYSELAVTGTAAPVYAGCRLSIRTGGCEVYLAPLPQLKAMAPELYNVIPPLSSQGALRTICLQLQPPWTLRKRPTENNPAEREFSWFVIPQRAIPACTTLDNLATSDEFRADSDPIVQTRSRCIHLMHYDQQLNMKTAFPGTTTWRLPLATCYAMRNGKRNAISKWILSSVWLKTV